MNKKVRNQKSKEYIDALRNNEKLQDFTRRLKFWRIKKGFNQIELSYACELSKNKIQEVESLFTSLSVTDLYKVCQVLDMPEMILFTDDETIINHLISEYEYSKLNNQSS